MIEPGLMNNGGDHIMISREVNDVGAGQDMPFKIILTF
jgi:hypothetical protein